MAPVMFTEIDSGDFVRPSVMPASTKPQFATGPLEKAEHSFKYELSQEPCAVCITCTSLKQTYEWRLDRGTGETAGTWLEALDL